MTKDLVIGIDVSTTATKAIAWSSSGEAVHEARRPLTLSRPAPHWYEQNAGDWWQTTIDALREISEHVGRNHIAGLAIAHQRETVVPIDTNFSPMRPAILWLDQRARQHVEPLVANFGEDRLRRITGKSPDFGPALYKLAWLREFEPNVHREAAFFCDVQAYLAQRLTDHCVTSWASADPFALFDLREHSWSPDLCAEVGINTTKLPSTCPPGTNIGGLTAEAAAASGLPQGTPLIAAGGDGQASGLGVNALRTSRAYLNLGTAVVFGVYSEECLCDPAWRTMSSCSGQGYYLESSLRSGALLSDWLLRRIFEIDPYANIDTLAELEREAATLPPGSDGILLIPYWEGAMNPYWDMDARGCMLGLTDAHDRSHLYRAVIEGVALEQALVLDLINERASLRPERFAAIGGIATSDLWCQIMADVLNVPIERAPTPEAASLGAAICAAAGVGWFDSMEIAARCLGGKTTAVFHPQPETRCQYQKLLEIYRDAYPQIRGIEHRLSEFTKESGYG